MFSVAGDSSVAFTIDAKENVTAISALEGTVTANFNDEIAVNGDAIQVTGDESIIVTGTATYEGISAIADVNAGATVAKWGKATEIGAVGTGDFTFGTDNAQIFTAGDTTDSNFAFIAGESAVTGVKAFNDGTIKFADVTALDVNVEQVAGQNMTFASESAITLTVEDYKVVGVEGITSGGSVSGIVDATIKAQGPVTVNGDEIDITDADESYTIEYANGALSKVTDVTGDATVNVAEATVETDELGDFVIGGESYTFTDEDGNATFTTGADGELTAVDDLNGSMEIGDGEGEFKVNGNDLAVTDNSTPVTVGTNGEDITTVAGQQLTA